MMIRPLNSLPITLSGLLFYQERLAAQRRSRKRSKRLTIKLVYRERLCFAKDFARIRRKICETGVTSVEQITYIQPRKN